MKQPMTDEKLQELEAAVKKADAAWNAANDAYHAAEADLKAYDDAHNGETT